jgi:hypothetical protein
MDEGVPPNETAYYYPEPYWLYNEADWVKSLLLFFDDVAILLPKYMRGRESMADPSVAEPLLERGLLKVIEPEWFVDDDATKKLTDVLTNLIESGAFDDLEGNRDFAEISMSRMGYYGDPYLAEKIFKALSERGLARRSRDGVSIPVHRLVRTTYLIILAQLARGVGSKHDLDLHPISNLPRVERAFTSVFNLAPIPSKGEVISFDLEVVSVDLANIPLDEVIQFRDENRDLHRRYMQNLRKFVSDLGLLEPVERQRALRDRKAELQEEAQALRTLSRKAWKNPAKVAGLSLGLAGAGLTLANAPIDVSAIVIALMASMAALLNMAPDAQESTAYTYLFRAADQLT